MRRRTDWEPAPGHFLSPGSTTSGISAGGAQAWPEALWPRPFTPVPPGFTLRTSGPHGGTSPPTDGRETMPPPGLGNGSSPGGPVTDMISRSRRHPAGPVNGRSRRRSNVVMRLVVRFGHLCR